MNVTSLSAARSGRGRRPTSTANFGSGRREAHDASAFYDRFVAPEISTDTTVNPPAEVDVIYRQDARSMTGVVSNSVALVVTSPPYFAGKQYEEDLGVGGVPADYFEYLELLRSVFDECKRVLEPGGRIAVNVANLGRRPYRSLSGDVTGILQDLGLLLRGEVIWWKGRAAGGSCAWGTFQRPSNPVLRDVTERVVIASKGRFDRALTPVERLERGLPSTATISRDEFMEATTDLWEIAPESATRVGHPAPFPVELPTRLIELYTYEGDVVLDPFMGSGSTAVAAVRTDRRYLGFDTDPEYVGIAERRVAEERERIRAVATAGDADAELRVELPAIAPRPDRADGPDGADALARAVREGRQTRELAEILLRASGFENIRAEVKPRGLGIELSFVATDRTGADWAFDVSGAFTSSRAGLRRTDTLWKSLGRAAVLHEGQRDTAGGGMPLVLLTTDAPTRGSVGHRALRVLRGPGRPVFDLVQLLDADDHARLRAYAAEGRGIPPS
ncbi:MAG: site-specific DNA-methyltransferase [Acidimicrobiales bacterium]|nr:site-specific DNA-methyltransferase [Acidimicrobiales bacterium]